MATPLERKGFRPITYALAGLAVAGGIGLAALKHHSEPTKKMRETTSQSSMLAESRPELPVHVSEFVPLAPTVPAAPPAAPTPEKMAARHSEWGRVEFPQSFSINGKSRVFHSRDELHAAHDGILLQVVHPSHPEDVAWLHAIRMKECGGNPDAESPAGALGPYQLMPGIFDAVVEKAADVGMPVTRVPGGAVYRGVTFGPSDASRKDLHQSAVMASIYWRICHHETENLLAAHGLPASLQEKFALAMYNDGPTNIRHRLESFSTAAIVLASDAKNATPQEQAALVQKHDAIFNTDDVKLALANQKAGDLASQLLARRAARFVNPHQYVDGVLSYHH